MLSASTAIAEEIYPEVKVMEPYIELHTGPGAGYPIFYVVDRGEFIEVIKRKTDWFKVRDEKGKTGWVSRAQLEKTFVPGGEQIQLRRVSLDNFSGRRWEAGLLGGEFIDSPVLSLYGAFAMTENLSAEVSVSQVTGTFTSSLIVNLSLLSQIFPRKYLSPFFTLGVGSIETRTKTTLIMSNDEVNEVAHAGVGLKIYLTRRFIFRAEYKNYRVFFSDDNNKGFEEWKAGVAFFF